MKVTPIRTDLIGSESHKLLDVLDTYITELEEGSVVAITSKIVSLCEGNTLQHDGSNKDQLIEQISQLYLPAELSKYGSHFTVTNNTLIRVAGIDESNADGLYVLWPKDSQATANEVRSYLKERFNLVNVGVVITDSTCRPMRRGTDGITLAHSGFSALKDYVGKKDLYGRPYRVTEANIAGGLASAAVVTMGEGSEQTPLCIISDVPFVEFQDRNPNQEELDYLKLSVEDDLFEPFLSSVPWKRGKMSE